MRASTIEKNLLSLRKDVDDNGFVTRHSYKLCKSLGLECESLVVSGVTYKECMSKSTFQKLKLILKNVNLFIQEDADILMGWLTIVSSSKFVYNPVSLYDFCSGKKYKRLMFDADYEKGFRSYESNGELGFVYKYGKDIFKKLNLSCVGEEFCPVGTRKRLDLLGMDNVNSYVAVEVKVMGSRGGLEQLMAYMSYVGGHFKNSLVRGVLIVGILDDATLSVYKMLREQSKMDIRLYVYRINGTDVWDASLSLDIVGLR